MNLQEVIWQKPTFIYTRNMDLQYIILYQFKYWSFFTKDLSIFHVQI